MRNNNKQNNLMLLVINNKNNVAFIPFNHVGVNTKYMFMGGWIFA